MTVILEPRSAAVQIAEKRSTVRRKTLQGAIIRFNQGYGALECVVRNRSDNGARLAFGDTAAVPAHFELKIAGESLTHMVDVRWRTLSAVGVSFS